MVLNEGLIYARRVMRAFCPPAGGLASLRSSRARLFLALAVQAFIFFLIKKRSKKIKAWRLLLLPVAIHPARISAAPSRQCPRFAP